MDLNELGIGFNTNVAENQGSTHLPAVMAPNSHPEHSGASAAKKVAAVAAGGAALAGAGYLAHRAIKKWWKKGKKANESLYSRVLEATSGGDLYQEDFDTIKSLAENDGFEFDNDDAVCNFILMGVEEAEKPEPAGVLSDIYGADSIKSWWLNQDENLLYSDPAQIRSLAEQDGVVFPTEDELIEFIELGFDAIEEGAVDENVLAKAYHKGMEYRNRGYAWMREHPMASAGIAAAPGAALGGYLGHDTRSKAMLAATLGGAGAVSNVAGQKLGSSMGLTGEHFRAQADYHRKKAAEASAPKKESLNVSEDLLKKIREFFAESQVLAGQVVSADQIQKLAEEKGFTFADHNALDTFIRIGLDETYGVEPDCTDEDLALAEKTIDAIRDQLLVSEAEALDLGVIREAVEKAVPGFQFENLSELREFASGLVPALNEEEKKPGFVRRWAGRLAKGAIAAGALYGAHKAAQAGHLGAGVQALHAKLSGKAGEMAGKAKKAVGGAMEKGGSAVEKQGKLFKDSLQRPFPLGAGVPLREQDNQEVAHPGLVHNVDMQPQHPGMDTFPGVEKSHGEGEDGMRLGPKSDTLSANASGSHDPAKGTGDAPQGGSHGTEGPSDATTGQNSEMSMKECPVCHDANAATEAFCARCGTVLPVNPNNMDGGVPAMGRMMGGTPNKDPNVEHGMPSNVASPYGGAPNKDAYIGAGAMADKGMPAPNMGGASFYAGQNPAMKESRRIETSQLVLERLLRGVPARSAIEEQGKGQTSRTQISGAPKAGGQSAAAKDSVDSHEKGASGKGAGKEECPPRAGTMHKDEAPHPENVTTRRESVPQDSNMGEAETDDPVPQQVPVGTASTTPGATPSVDAVNRALAQNGFHPITELEVEHIVGFLSQLGENVRKAAQYTGHPLPLVQIVANLAGFGPQYGYPNIR